MERTITRIKNLKARRKLSLPASPNPNHARQAQPATRTESLSVAPSSDNNLSLPYARIRSLSPDDVFETHSEVSFPHGGDRSPNHRLTKRSEWNQSKHHFIALILVWLICVILIEILGYCTWAGNTPIMVYPKFRASRCEHVDKTYFQWSEYYFLQTTVQKCLQSHKGFCWLIWTFWFLLPSLVSPNALTSPLLSGHHLKAFGFVETDDPR